MTVSWQKANINKDWNCAQKWLCSLAKKKDISALLILIHFFVLIATFWFSHTGEENKIAMSRKKNVHTKVARELGVIMKQQQENADAKIRWDRNNEKKVIFRWFPQFYHLFDAWNGLQHHRVCQQAQMTVNFFFFDANFLELKFVFARWDARTENANDSLWKFFCDWMWKTFAEKFSTYCASVYSNGSICVGENSMW